MIEKIYPSVSARERFQIASLVAHFEGITKHSCFSEMRYRSYEDGSFISYGLTEVPSVAEKAFNHFCNPVYSQKFASSNSW